MKIRSKITLLCLRENDGKVRFKIATKVTGGCRGSWGQYGVELKVTILWHFIELFLIHL